MLCTLRGGVEAESALGCKTSNMAQHGPPIIEGFTPEVFESKFKRKLKENPLVPIGCLATTAALTYGLICFKNGKTRQSQLMMRTRVAAQGFTLAAIMLGIFVTSYKSQKPPTP